MTFQEKIGTIVLVWQVKNVDIKFTSKEELYKRVKPALRTKRNEFARLGFSYFKETDIWNFLIKEKWKNGNQLYLADIVSDIMHVKKEEVDEYLKSTPQQTNDNNNLEIL